VQPADLRPPTSPRVSARPGFRADVVAFVKETMGADIRIHHMPELASWTVDARQLGWMAAGTSEWGTDRRHAGELLPMRSTAACRRSSTRSRTATASGACSTSSIPRRPRRSCTRSRRRSSLDLVRPDRTDRLARVYNDRFNNIAPRAFNGSHLKLPGASGAFSLYGHQKRGIWRIISAGSTYLATPSAPARP
jgi:N12 class adenine-specific DNA methylase